MDRYLATLRAWWVQPDHFDWLSSYLEAQRLRGLTRLMMVCTIVLLGTAPVLMHWSPDGPAPGLPSTVSVIVAVITGSLAAGWALRWPTRGQSIAFAFIAAVCIALACLLDRDPAAGLLGCAVFAAIAGYVAFFHASPHLVAVIGLGVLITAVNSYRVAEAGDPAAAASKFLVVLVGLLAVPSSVQVLVRLLGSDAVESDLDALTGVANRRGFQRSARELVVRARDEGFIVGVILVDLDGFKHVNDTHGHAAGDRLLIAVSDILRRHGGDENSVAARFGGEEFVVCGHSDVPATAALAERVRRDVAALPDGITVSIGSANSQIGDIADHEVAVLLARLVEAADDAMYAAKRAGGNRVQPSGRLVGLR